VDHRIPVNRTATEGNVWFSVALQLAWCLAACSTSGRCVAVIHRPARATARPAANSTVDAPGRALRAAINESNELTMTTTAGTV